MTVSIETYPFPWSAGLIPLWIVDVEEKPVCKARTPEVQEIILAWAEAAHKQQRNGVVGLPLKL